VFGVFEHFQPDGLEGNALAFAFRGFHVWSSK
jgi:hypothetical protein